MAFYRIDSSVVNSTCNVQTMPNFQLIFLDLWLLLVAVQGVIGSREPDFECDTSVPLENGHYSIARKVGFLKASCRRGYSLAGNKFIYCDNRSWTATLPKCVRATCSKRFTVPEHALTYETHQGAVVSVYCHSNYTLVGADKIYCNGTVWKPSLPACIHARDTKPERRCTFDTDLCGFTHDPNHDFDWSRENSLTPRYHVDTGPKHDHTLGVLGAVNASGYYMFIESSSQRAQDKARLYSPVYEPVPGREPICLRFFYHMFGSGIGALRAYVKPVDAPALDTVHMVFERAGNHGDRWLEANIRLDSLVRTEFQVVFEGIRGSSVVSNIAIDDFELIDNCRTISTTAAAPSVNDREQTQPTTPPPPPPPSLDESCERKCGLMGVSCSCQIDCARNSSCCVDYAIYCFLDTTTENSQVTSSTRVPVLNAHMSADEQPRSTDLLFFTLLPLVVLVVFIAVVALARSCYAQDMKKGVFIA